MESGKIMEYKNGGKPIPANVLAIHENGNYAFIRKLLSNNKPFAVPITDLNECSFLQYFTERMIDGVRFGKLDFKNEIDDFMKEGVEKLHSPNETKLSVIDNLTAVKLNEILQELGETVKLVHNAFFKFRDIGDKIIDAPLNENDSKILNESYDSEIAVIKQLLAKTYDKMERVKKVIPKNLNKSTLDIVEPKIKTWAYIIDGDVGTANGIIFELATCDKWTAEVPNELKKTYKELLEATSKLYIIYVAFNDKYNVLIPKTKNILGFQLHVNALKSSATDNNPFQWLTIEQFNRGMKSTDLKPS